MLLNIVNAIASWKDAPQFQPDATFGWVVNVVDTITTILWPLLIVVAAAGLIYSVIIGVNMAKADSTEKREEAKKRLFNLLIGMGVTIGLILFFILFINTILPAFFPNNEVDIDSGAAAAMFKLLK